VEVLRQLRKTLTRGALQVGMEVSQRARDPTAVEALRGLLLVASRTALPLRVRLARNMKLAGVYRKGLVDAHFRRAIDQIVMLAHVFRAGFPRSGCLDKFKFDDSFRLLEQAYARGRGVINIAPHICGYPVYAPVVTPRIPCSIYLRRNENPRKMRITEAVGRAGDGHLVYPPAGAAKTQRLQVAIDVLREGRMLFLTPDTPRKPHEGVPVSVFGRTTYFPTGVFTMAMRTGAPVVPVVWHWEAGAYHLRYAEPLELARGRGVRRQANAGMRKWAASVDAFLHRHPEMWWNWLDKRWTGIIRNHEPRSRPSPFHARATRMGASHRNRHEGAARD
jgi:lauroyl/myristoyl acyltransferase